MEEIANIHGKGFDFSSLYQYVKFYRCFPEILDAVSPKSEKLDATSPKLLPWTLYRELIRVEDAEARKWYESRIMLDANSTIMIVDLINSCTMDIYHAIKISDVKDFPIEDFFSDCRFHITLK